MEKAPGHDSQGFSCVWCRGGRHAGLRGFKLRPFSLALCSPVVLARAGYDLLIHETVNHVDPVNDLRQLAAAIQFLQHEQANRNVSMTLLHPAS